MVFCVRNPTARPDHLSPPAIIWADSLKQGGQHLSYEIHLNIPEDSQRGHLIASLAAEQHITPNQAVEKIIDIVAQKQGSAKTGRAAFVNDIVAEALLKVDQVRAERTQELVALSSRNDSASKLIGILKDEPEIVEAIREAGRERRQAMYS